MPADLDDVLRATSPAQLKALSHPLRHRLLLAIPAAGATISQLSTLLATNKGNVSHHLKVLAAADLVRRDRTNTVRGGTEQYWVRPSRHLQFPGGNDGAATRAMLASVTEDLVRAEAAHDPLLHLRHVRLTHAQAKALAAHLDRVVHDLEPAGPREPAWGVVVGVYRREQRGIRRAPRGLSPDEPV